MKLSKLFSLAMLLAAAVVMSAPLAYSYDTEDAHEKKAMADGYAHDVDSMVEDGMFEEEMIEEGYEEVDEAAEEAEDALSSMVKM